MNGKERMAAAMRPGKPDRVPVMCQLSLGHYFLHVDRPNEEIWFSAEGFADALVTLARRYRFDGVLVNLMPQPPEWRAWIERIEDEPDGTRVIHWRQGGHCRIPPDDNLHRFPAYEPPPLDDVVPAEIYYDDPHGIAGMAYPFRWHPGADRPDPDDYFPDYLFHTIDLLREGVGDELSIHGELFSPFTQLMELFGYTNALMHLMTDADTCRAILARYAEGAADLAVRQARRGVDAILISSAFAGSGFISREWYTEFVQPYEKCVVDALKAERADLPVYVHTCGSIGDRLELMIESGLNGVDTLDPPPLGDVVLADAVERLKGRAFIKGNIDPVNTMLRGTVEQVRDDARARIETAGPHGGYILSTACSVSPHTPPENLAALAEVAEEFGRF